MELFRTVCGYEGKYEVSNMGNVRSLSRSTLGRWGKMKTSPGRMLKPSISNVGYLRIDLCQGGKPKHHSVHRLVAIAFVPNKHSKGTVNHINGNKLDNRADNLEWATPKEQTSHAKKNGLLNPSKGDNHPRRKQTECIHGHKFTKDNTYLINGKYRQCKQCGYDRKKKSRLTPRAKRKDKGLL